MSIADPPQYWWCLEHQAIETTDGCANTDRLGPYDEYADAAQAIELAQKRSEEWDADEAWNDDPAAND